MFFFEFISMLKLTVISIWMEMKKKMVKKESEVKRQRWSFIFSESDQRKCQKSFLKSLSAKKMQNRMIWQSFCMFKHRSTIISIICSFGCVSHYFFSGLKYRAQIQNQPFTCTLNLESSNIHNMYAIMNSVFIWEHLSW